MKKSQIQIMADFMEGINTMIDASGQMASCHRLNPKWMAIRDMLNIIKDGAKKLVKDGVNGQG